jgi:hypothetical protein
MAEIYDRNMKKYRDVQGEINEILDFLDLNQIRPFLRSAQEQASSLWPLPVTVHESMQWIFRVVC